MKTKVIIFRVSESEHDEIAKQAKPFLSITNYIKTSLREFSNKTHKEKIEASKELINLYKEVNLHLAHIGGNLNQTVHRINELTKKKGINVSPIITNEIYPQLEKIHSLCLNLQNELLKITDAYRI